MRWGIAIALCVTLSGGVAAVAPAEATSASEATPASAPMGVPTFGAPRQLMPVTADAGTEWYPQNVSGDGTVRLYISTREDTPFGDCSLRGCVLVDDDGTWSMPYPLSRTSRRGAYPLVLGRVARVSRDGRWVVWTTTSDRILPGDTNGLRDVFVHDRVTGRTELVDEAVSGGFSRGPGAASQDTLAISADGRYVAFVSDAQDLVARGNRPGPNVFVRDRLARTTTRVGAGAGSVVMSGDGRYVAFASSAPRLVDGDRNHVTDAFVHDLATGVTEAVTVDDHGRLMQWNPDWKGQTTTDVDAISDDGHLVMFDSEGVGMDGVQTTGAPDVYLRDRTAGTTRLISRSAHGVPSGDDTYGSGGGLLTPDGRVAVFGSDSGLMTDFGTGGRTFLYDVAAARWYRSPLVTGAFGITDDASELYVTYGSKPDVFPWFQYPARRRITWHTGT